MTGNDESVLRSKASALARSVWDEHRKTAVMTFDTLSFEAREIMVDCCLKGMCVGIGFAGLWAIAFLGEQRRRK